MTHPSAGGGAWRYRPRGYALAASLSQFSQRPWSSLITLLVLGITLALPVSLWFSAGAVQSLLGSAGQRESITAYLDITLNDLDGAEVARELNRQVGVDEARYISRDEALATFQANVDAGDALDALGDNPFPGAVIVYPSLQDRDKTTIPRLIERLQQHADVRRVQVDLEWVQRLQASLQLLQRLAAALALVLTATALLVLVNTVRLELARREQEQNVSRLLGASRRFLNRPLLYTGAAYGLLAGLTACLFSVALLLWLNEPVQTLAQRYNSSFELTLPPLRAWLEVLAATTGLGVISALATLYTPSRRLFQPRRIGL